jgi:hypothetical protein
MVLFSATILDDLLRLLLLRLPAEQTRSGRLQQLLRRSYGSSEGAVRTGVLGDSIGQGNAVVLYSFVRLGLIGPRKARPARALAERDGDGEEGRGDGVQEHRQCIAPFRAWYLSNRLVPARLSVPSAVSLLHSADRDLLLHDDGHDVVHVARQQLHTRTH